MKYNGTEIAKLSDDELWAAIHSIGEMDGFRVNKLDSQRSRHKKLFDKHPPVENPVFTELATALNSEFKSRKLGN